MQNIRNNSPSFKAKIVFIDRGKCFSHSQKSYLRSLAKQIGSSEDRFYVGTRKYKYLSAMDYKTRFQCKDVQVLSTVNGVNHDYRCMHREIQNEIENETSTFFYDLPQKERWSRFNEKLYDFLKEFLETYNKSASKESSRVGGRTTKETRKIFKNEVSEFSKLKTLSPKKTLKQWLSRLMLKNEPNLQAPVTEVCKPYRSERSAIVDENPYDILIEPIISVLSDSFKI